MCGESRTYTTHAPKKAPEKAKVEKQDKAGRDQLRDLDRVVDRNRQRVPTF